MRLPQLLFSLYFVSSNWVISIGNGVTEKPTVHCGVDEMRVEIQTEKEFRGRIYVQGEVEREECVRKGEESSSPILFSSSYGSCGMKRQRILHPRGVEYSFTLILSFHPFFVTAGDRAFNVKCFFVEDVKRLDSNVDVGLLTTEILEESFRLPPCEYVLKGENGEQLQFAQVGQAVTHLWKCDEGASPIYGMLIHSCQVDDGHGNTFRLVDERGCSLDEILLPQLEYSPSGLVASANGQIFKYADKLQVYFTCTVQLCFKHDGGCDGLTPPKCAGSSSIHGPALESLPHIETPPFFPGSGPIILPQQGALLPHIPSHKPFPMPNGFGADISAERPDIIGKPIAKGEIQHESEPLKLPGLEKETAPFTITSPNTPYVTRIRVVTGKNSSESEENNKRGRSGRDLTGMKSNLKVDVVVLPLEKKNNNLEFPSSLQQETVCLSPLSTLTLIISIVLLIGIVCTSTYLMTRKCNQNLKQQRLQ